MKNYENSQPIILCGFMGSGKTTIGKPLAKALGYDFLDTDELLVKTYRMTINEMFEKGGEGYFRDLEHKITRQVADMKKVVISTGGGLMTFERNGEILSKDGFVIYLDKSFEDCYRFLRTQKDRPIVLKNTKEQLHAIYDNRIASYLRYTDLSIKNNGTVKDAVNKIKEELHI